MIISETRTNKTKNIKLSSIVKQLTYRIVARYTSPLQFYGGVEFTVVRAADMCMLGREVHQSQRSLNLSNMTQNKPTSPMMHRR